jgi:hypothetical protein
MAGLAKIRRPLCQKLGVVAAVNIMAVKTVLFHRRMLPHKRPPFVSMAFVAKFVYRVSLDHLVAEFTVRIVAVTA